MPKIHLFVIPGDGDTFSMLDMELLNILQINYNTIGTKKRRRVQITMRTKGMSSMQEVSSAMQTQVWKRIVIRRTTVEIPAQTQTAA